MQSPTRSEKNSFSSASTSAKTPVITMESLKPIWNEFHFFLQDAESKLSTFKKYLDKESISLESSAQLSASEFKEFLHEGEVWFSNLAKRAEQASEQLETKIDTTKVKIHLAQMDSKDRAQELLEHLDKFASQVEALVSRTERETSQKLESLAKKCRSFRMTLKN